MSATVVNLLVAFAVVAFSLVVQIGLQVLGGKFKPATVRDAGVRAALYAASIGILELLARQEPRASVLIDPLVYGLVVTELIGVFSELAARGVLPSSAVAEVTKALQPPAGGDANGQTGSK